jgi:hypothetical protein
MSSKETVSFKRSEDFESIDDELAVALSVLDEANSRVLGLLETESRPVITAEEAETSEESNRPLAEAPQSAEGDEQAEETE